MNAQQRAAQLWTLLVFAARTQQIMSYKTVERLTGLPARSLATLLGRVAWYCERKRLPPLTAIVVNETTGLPGHGYPRSHQGLDVLRDQSRVFAFDWLQKASPTERDFREPYGG